MTLPPLRPCLLSGGESRRMGRDKALLPHPEGGTWLRRSLVLLQCLGEPVSLLSRHPAHQALAQTLGVIAIAEPPPWDGPLRALARLMAHYPEARLLLCPVDMPHLDGASLRALVAASDADPATIHLAHDGERLQPLLAVVPSPAPWRDQLTAAVDRGERRLQHWLTAMPHRPLPLDPHAIRNVNQPEEVQEAVQSAGPASCATLDAQRSSSASTSASSSALGAGNRNGPSS